MGNKGVQRRRRNALAANSSNLHKAQFGKASKFAELPEAPKSAAFAQPVSKSTRKVQQLMAATCAPNIIKAAMAQSNAPQPPHASLDVPKQDANEGAECQTMDKSNSAERSSQQQPQNVPCDASAAPVKTSKTKLKKKNHLVEKKMEKRKKFHYNKQKSKGDAITDGKKATAFQLEAVPFGEVADAPPEVSLKRKNHVDDKGGASRHSIALQKHLEAGRNKLVKGMQGTEAREAVMVAYRAGKSKQNSNVDRVATMDSLKALVRSQALSQSSAHC